uniref:Ovule protein n=1 Tax=Syphacia muris TaxID=451379 RepID=A0A0N5AFG8_9BILA
MYVSHSGPVLFYKLPVAYCLRYFRCLYVIVLILTMVLIDVTSVSMLALDFMWGLDFIDYIFLEIVCCGKWELIWTVIRSSRDF